MIPGINKVEFASRKTCPLHDCGGSEASGELRLFESVDDELTGRTFRILRCSTCGAGLTDPYPTESTVKWLYEGRTSVSNFDPIRGTLMDKLKDFLARRDIRRIHTLGGHPKINSVLDFGAGNGRFTLASRSIFPGCNVDAVDFDPDPPSNLNGLQGIRYLPLETFLKTSEQYDLILLRYVLEHVHDPVSFLRTLTHRLSPGGILYIEVPNINSAHIRYFGRIANAFSVPYHLFNFDITSLESVIHSAGLNCRITHKGLPMAGCVLATLLKQERSFVHQIAGMILHPVQMVMDWKYGKYILAAICHQKSKDVVAS